MNDASAAIELGRNRVRIADIFWTFLVIGATSFGGGVVAYLRSSLVSKRAWFDDDQFLELLEISQTLPGLNATNMAVLVGDKLRGPIGAIAALTGILLPGAAMILGITLLYVNNHDNPNIEAILKGVGAASVGLLLAVTLQLGHKQLEHHLDLAIVIVTLLLVSFLHISLVIVLLTVAPIAILLYRPRKDQAPPPEVDRKPGD